MKRLVIILSAAVIVLAGACVWLYGQCENHRFMHIGTTIAATYMMFDQKTAQACWAGPPSEYSATPPGGQQKPKNGMNIPFCKDLK